MQTVYATHLLLPDKDEGSALEFAAKVVVEWVKQRFGVHVSPLSGGAAEGRRAKVEWESLFGDDRGVVSVAIDQTDQYDAAWRWRSFVEIGVEEGAAWVRVRVALYSPAEGRLTSPKVAAGRPGVVRALVDELDIQKDGWGLGEWRPVNRDQVEPYLAFVQNPDRQLPIVALSRDARGETFLDAVRIADRLLGLAHVVVVDADASYAVTEAVGKSLSCFGGAVRIYFPGFAIGDDPYFHRLYVGGTLTYLGREGVEREIFELLGRLAGLSLDEPPLRRRLKVEQREARLQERDAELVAASERMAHLAAAPDDAGPDAFDEFVAEFEEMRVRAAEAERAAIDAEAEIETLRKERDGALSQIVVLAQQLGTDRDLSAVAQVEEAPDSLVEAVRRAAEGATHTSYLDEAFESAEESSYPDPVRVLEDLKVVDEVARDWANGELNAGPNEAFKQRCSGYRDGIGHKASTQYAADYERQYAGQSIMLGPHIRRGTGAVTAILRIYMYFDTATQRIIVGHVGRKLRDAGNRN